MNLDSLGWNENLAQAFLEHKTDSAFPARVTQQHRDRYAILGADGEREAVVTGQFRHGSRSRADFPAVGDWTVAVQPTPNDQTTIAALLPRKSAFSRKVAGEVSDEQVLAANVDIAFLVNGLDGNHSLRRIERYLASAWDSGATPVVVLNKADLCDDIDTALAEVEGVALGADILAVSAARRSGIDDLAAYLKPGMTGVLLGSSGVGKSTIVNALIGHERQAVTDVREADSKGRHTTVSRELIVLPDGGLLIDTPGLRELQLWIGEDSLQQSFSDIEQLASNCRFRDCTHRLEPGCAVREALTDGSLDSKRFDSYLKLQRELRYLERRQDARAAREERDKWKRIAVASRKRYSDRDKP
jgi:ribosome biogenesis GTPase